MRTFSLGPLLLLLSLSGASAAAADTRHVAWTRQLPERQPMWAHNSRRYPMDGVATVVDAGDLVLVGCTADGTVRAYRRADGGEAWRFAFDGAVRWTPTVAGDAVFVGSDDGIWVFAVDAATGEERLLRRQLKDRLGGRVVVEGDSLAFARLGGRCDEAEDLGIVFDIVSGERRYTTDAKGKVMPASLRAPKPDRPPLLRLVRGDDNTYTFSEATQSHDVAKAIDAGAATPTKLPATGQQNAPLEDPTGGPGMVTQCLPSADAANASGLVEADLKFPLGVHWYGGPADSGDNFMVPSIGTQEGQVPQPQAHLLAKGVWIQQGIGRVVAYDQYTGRFLWKQELPAWYPLPGLGVHSGEAKEPWDDPASNLMPVTSRDMCRSGGFNMSCNTNELFIAAAKELRVYDLLTGMQRAAWKIPAELGDLRWGHLRVDDQVVVASVFSGDDLRRARAGWDGNGGGYAKDRQPMRHLVCLDVRTGDIRWKADPARGFVNHGFAMGGGRVYAVDLLSGAVVKGIASPSPPGPTTSARNWRPLPLPCSCDDTVVAEQVDPLALAKAPRTGAVLQAEVTPKGPIIKVTLTAKDGSLPPVIGGILIERLP